MPSVNEFIGFGAKVALGSFVTLAPVVKRGMGLTDISHFRYENERLLAYGCCHNADHRDRQLQLILSWAIRDT
jgi:hypothetical protein